MPRRATLASAPIVFSLADVLGFPELAGRLVELSAPEGCGAQMTVATGLVLDAQRRGEPVAWVSHDRSSPYPPDLAAAGIDLEALAVVRLPVHPFDVATPLRVGSTLLRSGAFGLVTIDLVRPSCTPPVRGRGGAAPPRRPPPALVSRLAGLARTHDAVALVLTTKTRNASSLGPLVSLRAETVRRESTAPLPKPPSGGTTADLTATTADDPTEGEPVVLVDIEILRDRRNPRRRAVCLAARAPDGVLGRVLWFNS